MSLRDFISKQLIDVIDWTEPEDGILAYRYPMQDREIQNGGKLTVRDSQLAVFVNEGKVADAFAPGLYTLNTKRCRFSPISRTGTKRFSRRSSPTSTSSRRACRPISTGARKIPSPSATRNLARFACAVSEFIPITSPMRKRSTSKISGTRDIYHVADLEGQLRNTIVAKMTDAFAASQVPFLDMAANQGALAEKITEQLKPAFTDYGLSLDTFVVENLSLPEELQKVLDQRISMNVLGDMGKFTQYQVAQAIPIAAGERRWRSSWHWRRTWRRRRHGPGNDGCREAIHCGAAPGGGGAAPAAAAQQLPARPQNSAASAASRSRAPANSVRNAGSPRLSGDSAA